MRCSSNSPSPADELHRRMSGREHFMPPSLLESQLATLEPLEADEAGVRVENAGEVDEVAARAAGALESALDRGIG